MKSMYSDFLRSPILCMVVLSALTIHNVYCVCNSNNAMVYVPIDPDNYDRNFSSISSIDKYPLGFNKSIWYYENADHPDPCFEVTGAANRRLEIMIETFPSSRLCVTVQGSKICSEAGTGRLYRCIPIPAQVNNVFIEFNCDSQCSEEDIRFWYRFVLGDLPENDPEDHWCDGRDQEEYPDGLLELPSDFPIPVDSTTPAGKATYLQSSIVAFLIAMSLHILF